MLRVSLRVQGGKHDGEIVSISTPKFLIGREDDCHLRPNSDMISRHHCAFTIDDYAVRLRDLGSTNGTYVNGERIRGVSQLNEGDIIAVGKLQFRLVIGDSQSGAPQPPIHAETGELSGEETHYELPVPPADQATVSEADGDTKEFSIPAEAAPDEETVNEPAMADTVAPQAAPEPAQHQQPAAMPPQPQYQYGYPPGQYPQQPGYYPAPPPMGYPPQMGGYYPQYPQQPYPYPQPVVMGQPMPGYAPQQPPPPQEQPQQPPPSQEQDQMPETRLPDPSTTGAKQPEAPPAAKNGEKGDTPPPAKDPSNYAADIIRQHLTRRPGGGE